MSGRAKVLIVGQAPGSKVQQTGVLFDDPSGDRLRDWMGVSRSDFYDADKIAILPMGFCYPGAGKSGDLPLRPECAATWRRRVLDLLPSSELSLLLGQHAMAWHLGDAVQRNAGDASPDGLVARLTGSPVRLLPTQRRPLNLETAVDRFEKHATICFTSDYVPTRDSRAG